MIITVNQHILTVVITDHHLLTVLIMLITMAGTIHSGAQAPCQRGDFTPGHGADR